MSKSLCISAAIAMALAAATSHSAQSECLRLKAGPARSACMQSVIRKDDVDAETVGRAIGHGTMQQHGDTSAAASPEAPAPMTAGTEAPAVGATSGAGAQAAGAAIKGAEQPK